MRVRHGFTVSKACASSDDGAPFPRASLASFKADLARGGTHNVETLANMRLTLQCVEREERVVQHAPPKDGAWQCADIYERTLTEPLLLRKVLQKLKQTPGHLTARITTQVGTCTVRLSNSCRSSKAFLRELQETQTIRKQSQGMQVRETD